jgi:flagellar assembly protein FliH
MTSIAHRYADFSPLDSDGQPAETVPMERVEDQKLQAFEDGYQAGWTDAEANHSAEQKNLGDEFIVALKDLSFSYQEALACLNRGLKPMFEQVIRTLLPQTIKAALRAHVVEQLMELAATQSGGQITLRVSKENIEMIEELLEDVEFKTPISLHPDEQLSEQQIFVALDMHEKEINLDAVCLEITNAMTAFNFHSQTE